MEKNWGGELIELAARVEGIFLFVGGRWFRSQSECEDFAIDNIPEGHFQLFTDIVSYPQFFIG